MARETYTGNLTVGEASATSRLNGFLFSYPSQEGHPGGAFGSSFRDTKSLLPCKSPVRDRHFLLLHNQSALVQESSFLKRLASLSFQAAENTLAILLSGTASSSLSSARY